MDEGLKATFVNPRLTDMLGYSPDEILGRPIGDFMHADEMPDHAEKVQLRRTGARSVYERKFCRKDGSPLWCLVSATPLLDAGGTFQGSFAMLTDITARKIARQDLEQKNLDLNAANEQMAAAFEELKSTEESLMAYNRELEGQRQALCKSEQALQLANHKLTQLSSITRHDILNELTVLSGSLELALGDSKEKERTPHIIRAQKAADRIGRQIAFTREYEQIGINAPVWQSFHTLVDTAAKQVLPGRVMVKNDLPEGMEVFADPLIVKVCFNLMDNAVRYGGARERRPV